MSTHVCDVCQKSFKTSKGLSIHKAKCKSNIICELCNKFFNKKSTLKDHFESQQHQDRQKIFDLTLQGETDRSLLIELKEKNQQYKEKYDEYKEKYEKCNQEKFFYKHQISDLKEQISDLKDEISDLKQERESFVKQLFELKSTPNIYHNNTNNYNSQSNSSTKIANICNVNNKLPLNNDFLSKLKDIDFIENVFADEQDICRWTLKQGLNNYILVMDKSRKVLSFTDDKGNTVRDQDGIILARRLYSELGQNLETVKSQLERLPENPNDVFVPTTLDKRKKIVDNIITKNPHSMERFGKAYFKEYAKFDQLENKEETQGLLQQDDEKNTYDEPLGNEAEHFSRFKSIVRDKFFQYEFMPLNYDLHQIGAFLNQFSHEMGVVERGGSDANEFYEWIKLLDDNGKAVVFDADKLLHLLIEIFSEEDIAHIIQCSRSSIFAKNTQLFIGMFINKKMIQNFEAIKRDIFQGFAGPK